MLGTNDSLKSWLRAIPQTPLTTQLAIGSTAETPLD
jgi:hypothetical protein